MTLRNAYEFILIECNKLKAPSILVEDFVYLFNKSIQQYINSVYNLAEYNQQKSDDLSFLLTTSILSKDDSKETRQEFGDVVTKFILPKDYMHMMNCIAEFSTIQSSKCGQDVKTISSPCRRLTSDLYPGILNNYYMKPSPKRPYYHIINRNTSVNEFTNPTMDEQISTGSYGNVQISIEIDGHTEYMWNQMKERGSRISNQSDINLDIHYGDDKYELEKIYITYLKCPRYVSMTYEETLSNEDTTDVLEFPDYVCYEIINICVKLLLENASDPRLATNIPVNQSIAGVSE